MRRTVQITRMIDQVNELNRQSTCSPLQRKGWNELLEIVLTWNNVFAGYSLLIQQDVPKGEKPGVIHIENSLAGVKNEFPDNTRRHYHTHRLLYKE
jgi:hypothetical protein